VTPGVRSVALAACLCAFAGPALAGNEDIAAAARRQVGVTTRYDTSYQRLRYPGGDVPADRGVCTDVVVRALRAARRIDLQREVHEDIGANFAAYPSRQRWGLSKPDANIDHRRVPNLMTFFGRAGFSMPVTRAGGDYLPGDIVAWDLGGGILHIGIVSARMSAAAVPLVLHNIGAGVREEDILFRYTVIGHYRMPPPGSGASGR
jgi:uncharacterized protein YijF (DUF1287 family)